MKVWKVISIKGNEVDLENKLNSLEEEGVKIKEVLYIDKFEYNYKIIYTVEDIMEVEDASN